MPVENASMFSQWTFTWIFPMLALGYQRPLQPLDLWKMPTDMQSGYLADKLDANFLRRKLAVEKWNKSLEDGTFKPWFARKAWWKIKQKVFRMGTGDGKQTIGLFGALSDTFGWGFWSGGVAKLCGDVFVVLSVLLVRTIIVFSLESSTAHKAGTIPPSMGKGLGLAFGLWAMMFTGAVINHQFFLRAPRTGVLARGALIASIYRRSMILTGEARVKITNGHLINHISTDVSRIDFACGIIHGAWTSPIQLIVIIIILLVELGPASLAGIAVLVLVLPAQSYALNYMYRFRIKAMRWTDQRVKLMSELLGGMQVLKFFAWESPYAERLQKLRLNELTEIRVLLILRAATQAGAICIPMMCSVVAFITFSALGHQQNPATIFTSLSLFNLLRMPLQLIPLSMSASTDGYSALVRLTEVFLAEVREETFDYDTTMEYAIKVEKADFMWAGTAETALGDDASVSKEGETAAPEVSSGLHNINLAIPRGQLTAIVGPVGSGKSSLLQGLIGEMKKTKGSVKFSGPLAYCPQQAWIQNCTVKENILFGQAYDENKYRQVIHDACLEDDILMLPAGDATQIGEKGITLSGGQKQRINVARALYFNSEICLLDDPLSAVDIHVGKHLFEHAICGSLADKTRVLVTHAVHFLPSVDYIICLDGGVITQEGTYSELVNDEEGAFSKLIREYGGGAQEKKQDDEEEIDTFPKPAKAPADQPTGSGSLITEEERGTGALSAAVLRGFLHAGKGWYTIPLLLLSLACLQASQVLGSYWLVFWSEDHFHKGQGFYMAIYGGLGACQVVFSFLLGTSVVILGYSASKSLHNGAVSSVLRAPMSFFDTSPQGRIMNRFSKDIDQIDGPFNDSLRSSFTFGSLVMGAIILVAIVEPIFLVAVVVIYTGYGFLMRFFRVSGRDLKRLDNYLRSYVYSHFGESLSGLPTIRAYGVAKSFRDTNEMHIDRENQAYLLTIVNQRWLALRLDVLGSSLILVAALVSVARRFTNSPSQTGLVLSFIIQAAQAMTWLVRFISEAEYDFNSIERVLQYSTSLPQEAPAVIENSRPEAAWPAQGSIELKNVVLSYRAGLPPVLKGISFKVGAGEKIGVVGRTGAGKSSIMAALFRLVELSSGSIEIDGVNIASIGLSDLRERVAILPQFPLLFSGTIRSNLDPFGVYDDKALWDAMRRSWLVEQDKETSVDADPSPTPGGRFTLDTVVADEGLNLSVGERSLVSLARALVKDSRIVVLDEATAAVDIKTDALIQDTIRTEFKSKTLLCIAHRLRTILEYDRILVMDAGHVAELDTPINLFRANGIFHSMCERSSITEADILALHKE